MEAQPECFVSGALATVLRLSRFAGVAPLRFEKNGNGWRVSFSSSLALFGHFIMTISCILFIYRFINEEILAAIDIDEGPRARTRRIVWTSEDIMVAMLAGITVYGAPDQMRYLIPCLKQMEKINSVHRCSTEWTRKSIALFIFWGTICLIATIADYVVVTLLLSDAKTWSKTINSFYHIYYWIGQLCKMQYALIVMHVRSGFTAVNDRLRSLMREIEQKQVIFRKANPSKSNNPFRRDYNNVNSKLDFTKNCQVYTTGSSSHHETVRQTALAYTFACDMVRQVDRSHGLLLLIFLVFLFLHVIVNYYYWIINLIIVHREDKTAIRLSYDYVFVFWSFVHTFNLVFIVEPCHLTHMEMVTTRLLVSRLMRRTHSVYDPLAIELDTFYKYLILNEVTYNPSKVITITRGLLLGILANVTIYLVVLIQIK